MTLVLTLLMASRFRRVFAPAGTLAPARTLPAGRFARIPLLAHRVGDMADEGRP